MSVAKKIIYSFPLSCLCSLFLFLNILLISFLFSSPPDNMSSWSTTHQDSVATAFCNRLSHVGFQYNIKRHSKAGSVCKISLSFPYQTGKNRSAENTWIWPAACFFCGDRIPIRLGKSHFQTQVGWGTRLVLEQFCWFEIPSYVSHCSSVKTPTSSLESSTLSF